MTKEEKTKKPRSVFSVPEGHYAIADGRCHGISYFCAEIADDQKGGALVVLSHSLEQAPRVIFGHIDAYADRKKSVDELTRALIELPNGLSSSFVPVTACVIVNRSDVDERMADTGSVGLEISNYLLKNLEPYGQLKLKRLWASNSIVYLKKGTVKTDHFSLKGPIVQPGEFEAALQLRHIYGKRKYPFADASVQQSEAEQQYKPLRCLDLRQPGFLAAFKM